MGNEIAKGKTQDLMMDRLVTLTLVEWGVGKDADSKTRLTFEKEIWNYAKELAGPDPTPIVLTLARTAALAWFAMRVCEYRLAGDANGQRNQTIPQSEHQQRQNERAHRRYLATLKTLATVRRLAVPALQINLATQQVNVANPSAEPPPTALEHPEDDRDAGGPAAE